VPIRQAVRVTVRSIVIVRHAKSARPAGVDDIDRALTPRGHADATAVGVWLSRHDVRPDLVICSPSRRTRQTWHGIAPALAEAPEVRYEPAVYGEDDRALLDLLRHVDNAVTTVVVIGHNPSVSELSDRLDPSADVDLRTSGIAVHRYDGDWAALDAGSAELVETHTARG
jgi:phosphohistidine phosphatase